MAHLLVSAIALSWYLLLTDGSTLSHDAAAAAIAVCLLSGITRPAQAQEHKVLS